MANLRDQLAKWNGPAPGDRRILPVSAKSEGTSRTDSPKGIETAVYFEIKTRLHQQLLSRLNLREVESIPPDRLKDHLKIAAIDLIEEEALPLNEVEHDRLVRDLQNEILGLGPLEPLLADPSVSEIMVNGPRRVFIERRGRVELTDIQFDDDAHLLKIIDRIVSRVGRRIDEASPMADARLPDGSRVNAIIAPLALDGPSVTIRRFATVPLKIEDLIAKEAMTPAMAQLLSGFVKAKANIIVAGGTGSGKTTLLNILSGFIPENERIVTLEDTAELQLQQIHVVRLESRPPNIEDKGAISMRALVRNSLRMRPDRIVVGEVRGGEVIDMLQAMNTGHSGSLTTIHANTARDTLGRLENLVSMSGVQLPMKALRQQIVSAVDVIVQTARISDGSRKVISISEITGMEGDVITMQDIFTFEIKTTDANGKVIGRFKPTGVRPKFADEIEKHGIHLDPAMFDPHIDDASY
ncbi:CpaF family protein [Sphingorhabdus sp.]|jgi:pilus assembly protein CpaF|uniref:CpaF family protein n=1 Tax=Sphingorhabdus sp. TaxID=1902408 RepID=UPI00347A3BD9